MQSLSFEKVRGRTASTTRARIGMVGQSLRLHLPLYILPLHPGLAPCSITCSCSPFFASFLASALNHEGEQGVPTTATATATEQTGGQTYDIHQPPASISCHHTYDIIPSCPSLFVYPSHPPSPSIHHLHPTHLSFHKSPHAIIILPVASDPSRLTHYSRTDIHERNLTVRCPLLPAYTIRTAIADI